MEETDLIKPHLVSICIPAYNCEKHIAECVRSVLNQTYKNLEIIIVDDGSTDGTPAILRGLENDRIRVFHQKNAGAAAARNFACKKSTGRYIKFLDGDDIINPGMIESQVKLAVTNSNCIISAKWGRFYNDDINTFKFSPEECWQTMQPSDWLCASWKNGNSMTQPGIFLLPRSVIDRSGLWNETLSLIDDMDFFTRAILNSKKVCFSPDAVLYYRSGLAGSLSDQKSPSAILSAFTAIDLSTTYHLAACASPAVLNASANLWQSFLYDIYPKHKALYIAGESRVNNLGGSTLKFKSGGLTKTLVSLIGWKIAKRIKHFFNRHK